jgi:endonuclease G, mitochondrial
MESKPKKARKKPTVSKQACISKDVIAARWQALAKDLGEVKQCLHEQRDLSELESPVRLQKYYAHRQRAGRQESLQGPTNDIESTEFLEAGLLAARSVGKIDTGTEVGTGFLIGENLLLTNHHVIESVECAENSTLIMDYEENFVGIPKASQSYTLIPSQFFMTNAGLDFTIVAVEPTALEGKALNDYGFHPLLGQQGKIKLGDAVNIIHHPEGQPKKITLRNNQLIFLKNSESGRDASSNVKNSSAKNTNSSFDNFCLYLADTLKGSSGAPVFNDRWELVAIHHAGVPMNFTDKQIEVVGDEQREAAELKANEGIRVSRIVAAIEQHVFAASEQVMEPTRATLLARWQLPRQSATESERVVVASEQQTTVLHANEVEIRIIVSSVNKPRSPVK